MNRTVLSLLAATTALSFNGQTWSTALNSGASSPKFGLATDHALGFYTNNTQRLTLTGAGRFGIGTASPQAELDVVGKGKFSAGLVSDGPIIWDDHFQQRFYKGVGGNPNVFYSGNLGGASKHLRPCNVWYKDPIQYEPDGSAYTVPWTPPTLNVWEDLMQVTQAAAYPVSALSMGVLTNGDAVIAVEPTPNATSPSQILKLNPGCSNDVYICEGGGQTKIFGNGYVVGNLEANAALRVGGVPFNANSRFELKANNVVANAIQVWNPNSTASNKTIFQVSNTGKTSFGTDLAANSAMMTIGQSVKADKALVLTDNTNLTNKDYFSVQGNGYTEIKVYSPTQMPGGRVLSIYDAANSKDLFVVKADGKVYAREVEISLATNFPDFVFKDGYVLRTIPEVEKFIRLNKHLPGFSEAAVYENKGINVTELMLQQQRQIEEQMLYIIELEKRLSKLEKQ